LPPAPPKVGVWAVLHEVRSEYAQLLTALFLALNGPGRWSLDGLLKRRRDGGLVQLEAESLRKESAKASAIV
jgi:putative oxidoreductase